MLDTKPEGQWPFNSGEDNFKQILLCMGVENVGTQKFLSGQIFSSVDKGEKTENGRVIPRLICSYHEKDFAVKRYRLSTRQCQS